MCNMAGRKMKLFEEGKSVWDTHRGRALPDEERVDMCDFEGLDALAASLREAKWRFTTRASYNRWFRCWQSFAAVQGCVEMPAETIWLLLEKRVLLYSLPHSPQHFQSVKHCVFGE